MAPKEAIFFDEYKGFVLVEKLGEGASGVVHLVRCVMTKKLEITNAKLARDLPLAATMKGYLHYVGTHPSNSQSGFLVSYWEFCNAGTLHGIIKAARSKHIKIPLKWVFTWLREMLKALRQMHYEGMSHMDAHLNNWFLHRNGFHQTPQIYLGDFDRAKSVSTHPDLSRAERMQNFRGDLGFVYRNMLELRKQTQTSCLFDGYVAFLHKQVDTSIDSKIMGDTEYLIKAISDDLNETPSVSIVQKGLAQAYIAYQNFMGYKPGLETKSFVAPLKAWFVAEHENRSLRIVNMPPHKVPGNSEWRVAKLGTWQ